MNENYKVADGKIVYPKNGKQVAHLMGENVVFEKGMSGPHTAGLEKFIKENNLAYIMPPKKEGKDIENLPPPQNVGSSQQQQQALPEDKSQKVRTFSHLPPFNKALGVCTPGFQEFCAINNLTESEKIALIRQLEM